MLHHKGAKGSHGSELQQLPARGGAKSLSYLKHWDDERSARCVSGGNEECMLGIGLLCSPACIISLMTAATRAHGNAMAMHLEPAPPSMDAQLVRGRKCPRTLEVSMDRVSGTLGVHGHVCPRTPHVSVDAMVSTDTWRPRTRVCGH